MRETNSAAHFISSHSNMVSQKSIQSGVDPQTQCKWMKIVTTSDKNEIMLQVVPSLKGFNIVFLLSQQMSVICA